MVLLAWCFGIPNLPLVFVFTGTKCHLIHTYSIRRINNRQIELVVVHLLHCLKAIHIFKSIITQSNRLTFVFFSSTLIFARDDAVNPN